MVADLKKMVSPQKCMNKQCYRRLPLLPLYYTKIYIYIHLYIKGMMYIKMCIDVYVVFFTGISVEMVTSFKNKGLQKLIVVSLPLIVKK